MLDLAKRQLRQILARMRSEIRAGVPVIGLEPSCTAVFRDELVNLFPDNADAERLAKQTFTFSEFLARQTGGYKLPRLGGKAIVHGHCHHKALFGMGDEHDLLDRLGMDYQVLEAGCCGMAGGFGYEAGEHYAVSMKAGERVLLPAVRAAPKDMLIIADGFSCRTQIATTTDRRAPAPGADLDPSCCFKMGMDYARHPWRAPWRVS